MSKIKDFFFNRKILISFLIIVLIFISYFIYDSANPILATSEIEINEPIIEEEKVTFFVDIKGAVDKPGVYEMTEGEIVMDLINKAGGLTKYATTANINLSKALTKEMVLKIFTKTEYSKLSKCNCEEPKVTQTITEAKEITSSVPKDNIISEECVVNPNKININTASLEELKNITGVGDSKAIAIISYREEHGSFNTIEDLMNVSGFGEATFAKIKENITV